MNLYQFQGRSGQRVVIEMTSQELNSSLILYQLTESSQGQGVNEIAKTMIEDQVI